MVGGRRPWLHTFDVEAGKTARVLFNEATGIKSTEKVAVSPDKSLLAIPGASGTVHVLSGRSKRPIFELQASGDIRDVCLTEKQVWGLSGEGEIYLWDVGERKCVGRWRDYGGQGRNGGRIAVGQGVVVTGWVDTLMVFIRDDANVSTSSKERRGSRQCLPDCQLAFESQRESATHANTPQPRHLLVCPFHPSNASPALLVIFSKKGRAPSRESGRAHGVSKLADAGDTSWESAV